MVVVNWKLVGMDGDAAGSVAEGRRCWIYMRPNRREGFDRRSFGIGRWNCCREKKRDNDLEGKQVEYLNSCRRLLQFCMAEIKFLMNLSMSRNPGKEEYHAGCEG